MIAFDDVDGFKNDADDGRVDGHFALAQFVENVLAAMGHIHRWLLETEKPGGPFMLCIARKISLSRSVLLGRFQRDKTLVQDFQHLVGFGQKSLSISCISSLIAHLS